ICTAEHSIPCTMDDHFHMITVSLFSLVDHICQRNLRSVEEVFFQTCDRELAKVNHFYSERLTEVQARLTSLKLALRTLHESQRAKHGSRTKLRWLLQVIRMDSGQQTERELKVAVVELYYSMLLLRSYRELNYIGFCKIMRKHGKRFNSQQGVKWRKEKLETSELHSSRRICQLISELEVRNGDTDSNSSVTNCQSVPDWTAFRLGVTCGLLLVVLAIQKPDWDPVRPLLRLYRGGFLLIEFLFLLGVNIYGWKRSGINYVLIFELNREDNLSYYHMFEVAGCLAVCWCLSVLACLHAPLPPVPLQLQPLLFYCLPILLLLNPTPTLHHRFRRWLLSLLGRVLTAPFHPVGFADFWLADQLNSLSALFLDMWGLICFYGCEVSWRDLPSMDPNNNGQQHGHSRGSLCLIQCFPPWLRFAQCIRNFWDSGDTRPHLLNAGKYSTVFMTVTFAGLFSMNTGIGLCMPCLYLYLWAAATCLSVLVTITWDLWMDWGLLQGPELLRKEVVTVYLLLWSSRRFIWNFFRLENEHLNNCRQFRAFRDIPMTPVALNGHSVLERVMDQEDTAKAHWKENSFIGKLF
uniref:Uncharacterized protein n=1 Tax=Scleropages formosus TaxID=113540 RepID=A0A8C9RTE5_SCLFO